MSVNPLIQKITESQLRNDIPEFRAGDTVRVHARIVEGKRERIQIFEDVHYKVRLLVSQNAAVNKTLKTLDFQGFFYLQKIRWG